MSRNRIVWGLIGWLMACFSAASPGVVIRPGAWYAALNKPAWNPPAWLFGPAWSLLYTLMAVAAWLVWRRHGFQGASAALGLYGSQLVANALWTWLFFAWHQGAWALAEIAVLWLLITGTMLAFWRLHRLAACLLLPYLAWVSFAAALNLALWRLNPTVLA